MSDVRDVIIIGGGPAGYTAALYAARANLSPLVIEGFNWGGQLMITSEVENYPGYRDGVMGPEMMGEFRAQAARFGAEFVTDDVTRIDLSERPFKIYVGDEEYVSQTVIVATGATARQLGLESERALHGRGVTYCATCDAAFYRDREVVVVGGGDSAMEEALYLTKFAAKVTLVHRRDEFRASQIMVDRVKAHEKIEIMTPFVVEEVLGADSGKLTGVLLRNVETGESHRVPDRRPVRRDRPRPDDEALRRLARPRRERLSHHQGEDDGDEHPGRLRRGRRPGSHLPAGDHRRRIRLCRRARLGALPRRGGRAPGGGADGAARAQPAGVGPVPFFICPNCKNRSIDNDGRQGLLRQAVSCERCGFGFLFEILDDYYPPPTAGLVACDRDGRILAAGRGVFELTGYGEQELMGKDVVAAFGLEGFEAGKSPIAFALEWGVRRMGEHLELRSRSGQVKQVTADVFPAYDEDGGVLVALSSR